MNTEKRQRGIVAWEKEKRARDTCCAAHHRVEQIPKAEEQEYNCIIAEMLEKYEDKKPPAMPCTKVVDGECNAATECSGSTEQREHQDKFADKGFVSEEYMAMIHTAIPDHLVKKITGAKDAIDAEWNKLLKLGAFGMKKFEDLKKVQERYAKCPKFK